MDDWDFSGAVDDLASMWSPSNLRSTDFLSDVPFSAPDLSALWSPSNFRSMDFLSNIPFSLPDTSNLLTKVSNVIPSVADIVGLKDAIPDVSDILGSSGRPRDVILNQDNPLVQTDISDMYLGDQIIPGVYKADGSLNDGGLNLAANLGTTSGFSNYSPSNYYGLTNPNLSEAARTGLYENISFKTASGASEFSKRLAGESGDTIRVRNPENSRTYFEAIPVKDLNGEVVRDGTGKPMVHVVEKTIGPGTGVIGEGTPMPSGSSGKSANEPQQSGAKKTTSPGGTSTAGSLSPLGAAAGLAALGGLTGMLTGDRASQNIPVVPTVRNIQPITTAPVTVQRPVNITPGYNDPRLLTQRLGAPVMMARGGLAHYARGGGGGQDDKIPAYLSDGEYVIDAATVSDLGDGSNEHGARILDQFRKNIREHKRSAPADQIPPKAKSPLHYLKG